MRSPDLAACHSWFSSSMLIHGNLHPSGPEGYRQTGKQQKIKRKRYPCSSPFRLASNLADGERGQQGIVCYAATPRAVGISGGGGLCRSDERAICNEMGTIIQTSAAAALLSRFSLCRPTPLMGRWSKDMSSCNPVDQSELTFSAFDLPVLRS